MVGGAFFIAHKPHKLRAESMINLTVLQPDKNTYYRLVDMLNAKEDILKGYAAQFNAVGRYVGKHDMRCET